jgi:hypothetical protein
MESGTLLVTGGSLALVDRGMVAEFASVTVGHDEAVLFAGRVEGGTLNHGGYVSYGTPRLVIAGVAGGKTVVVCTPALVSTTRHATHLHVANLETATADARLCNRPVRLAVASALSRRRSGPGPRRPDGWLQTERWQSPSVDDSVSRGSPSITPTPGRA